MTQPEALDQLRSILQGIDQCEYENDNGWWETATGAGFGARKLAEVEALIGSL